MIKIPLALVPACALIAACTLTTPSGSATARSVTYENTVRKFLAERCLECHGADAPSLAEFDKDKEGWKKKVLGPRMTDYASVIILVKGSDAGAMMRRLDDGGNTSDGKPGNMYTHLGDNDRERAAGLARMKQWVGSWSLKRRKDLSAAELAAITAPEK